MILLIEYKFEFVMCVFDCVMVFDNGVKIVEGVLCDVWYDLCVIEVYFGCCYVGGMLVDWIV